MLKAKAKTLQTSICVCINVIDSILRKLFVFVGYAVFWFILVLLFTLTPAADIVEEVDQIPSLEFDQQKEVDRQFLTAERNAYDTNMVFDFTDNT